MSEPVNILTLKWGTAYGPNYVNHLRRAVARHLTRPHRFVCFTDDATGLDPEVVVFPIPEVDLPKRLLKTPWRKLGLFRDDLPVRGVSLFLDLDLLVVDNIDCLFDYEPDRIPIIHNWIESHKIFKKRPEVGNSSVFRFRAGECGFVGRQYASERDWAQETFWPPQTYLTHCIRPKMVYWPEEWIRSFKRHALPPFPLNHFKTPRIPAGAKIVVFHGWPNPHEALAGYRGEKLNHRCLPTPWVADHWY